MPVVLLPGTPSPRYRDCTLSGWFKPQLLLSPHTVSLPSPENRQYHIPNIYGDR